MELYSDYPCLTEEFLRKQVDAAIFDIGNVLIDFAWQDYMKSLDFDRVTYEHVADAMFRSEDWDQGDLGRITTEEWLNLFIENDPEYEDAIRRTFSGFGASIIPYDFSEEWISYFRKHGIKLYFLSNYSPFLITATSTTQACGITKNSFRSGASPSTRPNGA